MPAEIVTMADCASNYGVFAVVGNSGTWIVSLGGSEGPAHCDCPAYKFSKDKDCKHISEVWEKACLYNPQWRDGKEDPSLRPIRYTYDAIIDGAECPACGGPVVAVRRAI